MRASGERPLRGKRVLITRGGEQSDSFASALRMPRARSRSLRRRSPIGELHDLSDWTMRSNVLRPFFWVVFTSQNGADVFMARLARRNSTADAVKIAAIGHQTAHRLRDTGRAYRSLRSSI